MTADTKELPMVITRVAVVVIAAALSACADLGQRPVAVQVRTVETVKTVPVPCVAAEDIPPKTPTAMPDPMSDTGRKAAGVYVDMHHLVDENDALRALLTQCTKGATP